MLGIYAHPLEAESRAHSDLSREVQAVLRGHETCKAALSVEAAPQLLAGSGTHSGFVAWKGDGPGVGIRASAQLSQVPCAYDDPNHDADPLTEEPA